MQNKYFIGSLESALVNVLFVRNAKKVFYREVVLRPLFQVK